MIWPRFELLEGPMAVGAVSGSADWSMWWWFWCRARGRSRPQLQCAMCSEGAVQGARKDTSVQRLAGVVQFCTQKNIRTRGHMCVLLNRF